MDHLLICACEKEHTVSRSQAGQEIQCECGNSIRIPTLRGLLQLPVAGELALQTPTSSAWSGWRGPTVALCAAVAFISAAFCGYFLFERSLLDTSYTLETEITEGVALFDHYGPDELSMVWNSLDTYGIGAKARPGFYVIQEYAADRELRAKITGAVSATFGLIVLGIWFSARRR